MVTALMLSAAAAFSPKDAAAPLFAAQQAALAKIQAALPLDAKTYPADLGLDTFTTSNGGAGAMQSWEAPGPANIAWVSDLRIEGPTTVASLTVWCAPLKDVPHLCVRTTATDARATGESRRDVGTDGDGAEEGKGEDGARGDGERDRRAARRDALRREVIALQQLKPRLELVLDELVREASGARAKGEGKEAER